MCTPPSPRGSPSPPTSPKSPAPMPAAADWSPSLSQEAFLEVVVTRAQLARWFDHLYDDGFSWLSEQGGRRFASMLDKTVVVARHCESTYQVLRATGSSGTGKMRWEAARGLEAYRDAPLTETGKLQAAALGAKLASSGFRPQLILSSPLTRCLQTAGLAFPGEFVPVRGAPWPGTSGCAVRMSHLLPEAVDSWADVGRPIEEVVAEHPHLARFTGAMSSTRFHRSGCRPDAALRPRRWNLVTPPPPPYGAAAAEADTAAAVDAALRPFPQEPRPSAALRAALVWRLLSENRPERAVAVFTHSKLIMDGYGICLLGPGVKEIHNGDFALVTFAAEGEVV